MRGRKSEAVSSNGVDDYLASVPAEMRVPLENLRKTIRATAPGSIEVISYGIPVVKLNGRPLVGFAAFKEHCSFFVMGTTVMKEFSDHFKPSDLSKATIRFPPDKPPANALVKKIVKARIAENEERERKKKPN